MSTTTPFRKTARRELEPIGSVARLSAADIHDYDVVVVGARCAGAATAMLLARRGARVALLDRAPLGSDTLSTHALMPAGVLQLHRWGLLERVIAAGTPAVRSTVFQYGTATTAVALKPNAGVDALYAPRRTVLDPILVEAARDAGVDITLGAFVTDVVTEPDGRVTGVVGHDQAGKPFHIRARATVGADGLNSRVARRVRAPVERVATSASAAIYGYLSGLGAEDFEWFYVPGLTAGVIPTNDRRTCVFVCAPPARFRAELARGTTAGFHRLVREVSPDLARRVASAEPPDRLRRFPGVPGFLRRPWGPGWALVGDAGYFKDPITAHGITDALRDAELLARAIGAVLADEAATPSAMQQYHRTRNRLSISLFSLTEAIASYAWDTTSIEGLLRSLNAAMGDEFGLLASLDTRPALRPTG